MAVAKFGRLTGALASGQIAQVGRADLYQGLPSVEFDNRLGNYRVEER